ncbi:helix-turn-helix domain-containing protein [Haladaptatus sp. ZSTT2]|uniref:helix-turn-helix domain-containing protein n=1 Tax=Haladaptatus sp. ZSTT2 TaxID=3120515 RepID=UPI00300E7DB6
MREFVFSLTYEPGADPVADVFMEYPAALAKSLDCAVAGNNMWRLDRITGPEAAVSKLTDLLTDASRCNECLNDPTCDSYREHELLAADTTSATIYTYRQGIEECRTLPTLAHEHLGPGLLYETQRRGDSYEWRILMRSDGSVGELYDAVQAELSDGVNVNLSHLSNPTHWTDEAITACELPFEQRQVLELAVANGYYETPRKTTLSELADEIDVPQSTLQYRLQRAESWLATGFVNECL